MTDTIYQTPSADLKSTKDIKGSPVKAVLLGCLTDIGGSMTFGIIFTVAFSVYLAGQGAAEADIVESLQNIELTSYIGIATLLIGLVFSSLGGYVCARIAKYDEYKFAGITGLISGAIGFLMGTGTYDLIENSVMAVLTFGFTVFGCFLSVRANSKI